MSAMSAMSAESSLVEMKYYFLTDSRARVIALYIYICNHKRTKIFPRARMIIKQLWKLAYT